VFKPFFGLRRAYFSIFEAPISDCRTNFNHFRARFRNLSLRGSGTAAGASDEAISATYLFEIATSPPAMVRQAHQPGRLAMTPLTTPAERANGG